MEKSTPVIKSNSVVISMEIYPDNKHRVKFQICRDGSYSCIDEEEYRRLRQNEEPAERLINAILGPPFPRDDSSQLAYMYRGHITDANFIARCDMLRHQLIENEDKTTPLYGEIASFLGFIFWRDINHARKVPLIYSDVVEIPR